MIGRNRVYADYPLPVFSGQVKRVSRGDSGFRRFIERIMGAPPAQDVIAYSGLDPT